MKTIVIYKSKTGFAKKYAEWIAEDLDADIFEVSKITVDMLEDYDTVIYGAGLYAVGINGVKYITQNLEKLKNKKIVIFATGMSPTREDVINEVKDKNFTLIEQKYIRFFYIRGGFDYSKLKPFDKILMTLLKYRIKLKNKKKLTEDERGMLASFNKTVDFVVRKNINEILNYIN